MQPSERYMKAAIDIAMKAHSAGEYPIGAVVVLKDEIIGAASPALGSQADPTAHAEIMALRAAALHLGSRVLKEAVLYSTLEPCPMCTSAAIWAKCSAIVFGASQEDAIAVNELSGAHRTFRQIPIKARYVAERGAPPIAVFEYFLHLECKELLVLPRR